MALPASGQRQTIELRSYVHAPVSQISARWLSGDPYIAGGKVRRWDRLPWNYRRVRWVALLEDDSDGQVYFYNTQYHSADELREYSPYWAYLPYSEFMAKLYGST